LAIPTIYTIDKATRNSSFNHTKRESGYGKYGAIEKVFNEVEQRLVRNEIDSLSYLVNKPAFGQNPTLLLTID